MTSVEFPLKPDHPPVHFRFTIASTRSLEKAAGVGIDLLRLRGQVAEAIVLMTCYGLKWEDESITEKKAERLVQSYVDGGGDIKDLSEALVKALNESGVYGKPQTDADGDANPTRT